MPFEWETAGCPVLALPPVSVPKAGEPLEPKCGWLKATASPSRMAPKVLRTPPGGDLNVLDIQGGPEWTIWVGGGRASLAATRAGHTHPSPTVDPGQGTPSELPPVIPALEVQGTHAFLLSLPKGVISQPLS